MNEDFVPYELAVKLKEKGFRKPCIGHYSCLDENVLKFNITTDCIRGSNFKVLNNDYKIFIDAPTISQVLKWLREEKKIYIMINFWPAGYNAEIYTKIGKDKNRFDWERYIDECDYYDSYKLAAIAGVEYCLDNLI